MQFKALCLAFYEELNVPKAHEAYTEIINSVRKNKKTWSHEVVEFIANRLPDDFFKIDRKQDAYTLFKTIYNQVLELVKQGHALPQLIEKKRRVPMRTPSVANAHLKLMKQYAGA